MNEEPCITVAIADDHILMRKGTISFINTYPEFKVIIEADNGKELLEKIEQSEKLPDIAVLDISMPEMNGYETAAAIKKRWPDMKILVLTMLKDEFSIIKMIRNGAKGYMLKSSHPDELRRALTDVYNDKYFSTEIISGRALNAIANSSKTGYLFPELTEMEMEILTYYCQGLDNKDIAKKIGTSIRNIDNYRIALFDKLNVQGRVELVVFALRTGLVSLED
jgi:two-component system invasion response regulator UvrY